jgi:hypothetical protein
MADAVFTRAVVKALHQGFAGACPDLEQPLRLVSDMPVGKARSLYSISEYY